MWTILLTMKRVISFAANKRLSFFFGASGKKFVAVTIEEFDES
jgi:hypothetical protein